ncbi:hypothetical protein JY651_30600 [Pyxidicoccus parkwayensis]|uniref:Uncharacterized protein n=1 Tax=Pyxidicoccus parkwayensis TaxID=2813578 RepID=A0ABX7PDW1_9BACT|nr:hypothetical protein [Pyxidicoccus parkwaysis]QSQ28622.1 hypothetical protein JY651_30600 [Pyxidicoccus parkwaysis]
MLHHTCSTVVPLRFTVPERSGHSEALQVWARRDNEHWHLEQHHFLSPSQARRELMQKQVA